MRSTELEIPPPLRQEIRHGIAQARGNEVFFVGRVAWDGTGTVARLDEVDLVARGNRASVPALIERTKDWDLAIHNHPSGELEPSEADNAIAFELGNRDVGFVILSSDAERWYVVVPPLVRSGSREVDPEEVRRIFGPGGALARELGGYEPRQGQIDMALAVTEAFNDGRVAACEAGTGVGKSFAYLVPSILWAVANRQRVVVSTGTIQLQEQLVAKDLPFLRRVLDFDFTFALIKGRGNYACRRKVEELPDELHFAPPPPEEARALEDLVEWVEVSEDGSLSDLAWTPPSSAWERVMSETDKSLKVNCRHYADCFYFEARRRAFKAHILVVNHHLFFADLAVRRQSGDYRFEAVLPGYARVVFDEAHHLEDVASEHLGLRFSRRGIRNRLGRMRAADGQRGSLPILARKLARWGDAKAAGDLEEQCASQLPASAAAIEAEFEAIEGLIEAPPDSEADGGRGGGEGAGREKLRYRPDEESRPLWDGVLGRLAEVRRELERVSLLAARAKGILERTRVSEEQRASARLEIDSFSNRLEFLLEDIQTFCEVEDGSTVRWIVPREGRGPGGRGGVGFAAAPVRVDDDLEKALFEPLDSLVLSSATLSVAGDPSFLAGRLGLDRLAEDRYRFAQFESPFDFARQVLTALPTDLPPPGSPAYPDRLAEAVLGIVAASGGRAFVLFTSYSLLRRTHALLEEEIEALGCRPLAQGQAPRSELLRRFATGPSGVLFGTDSFWEGVDVPGRALECVIITRLPFRVPSEPLQEARLEEVGRRGANPFVRYTVPQAVLRFKQGFGRLIRARSDRGVVAILDSRVLSRPYGKTFLASLPSTRRVRGPLEGVTREVEQFFAAGGGSGEGGVAEAAEGTETPAAGGERGSVERRDDGGAAAGRSS